MNLTPPFAWRNEWDKRGGNGCIREGGGEYSLERATAFSGAIFVTLCPSHLPKNEAPGLTILVYHIFQEWLDTKKWFIPAHFNLNFLHLGISRSFWDGLARLICVIHWWVNAKITLSVHTGIANKRKDIWARQPGVGTWYCVDHNLQHPSLAVFLFFLSVNSSRACVRACVLWRLQHMN